MDENLLAYTPDFPGESWSDRDRYFLEPFATGLDGFVHVLRNLPPEITGALCSRASRASDSLLRVLLKEYIYPILDGEDKSLAAELEDTVKFLKERGFRNILNNQRAQQFYAKWLSQYGDDSIAQMTGSHLVFWGISQVAIKFIEDQRLGLEPIEKSTRYVNFGNKIGGNYLYYTPKPDLERIGLLDEYRSALDYLFDNYASLLPKLLAWLKKNYDEKESILEKKAFDALRGLLPMATLGQVAFRGNAQAFEYLINRTARHQLGELRWIAQAVKTELDNEIPSLLLRVNDERTKNYQNYLAERKQNVRKFLADEGTGNELFVRHDQPTVSLVEWDPDAETKIIAGIVFAASHLDWNQALEKARRMSPDKKEEIIEAYLKNRTERWHKVGRAFENSYLRFEITLNVGAYRDIHRHRPHTQERQLFSTHHGFDVSKDIREAGLEEDFSGALVKAASLFQKLEAVEPELAQYAVAHAYRTRFYQWQNFREFFWEVELRTGSQGHPDYRFIEQEKWRRVSEKLPLLASFVKVDLNDYAIPRRGTEEKIAEKEKDLMQKLGGKKGD